MAYFARPVKSQIIALPKGERGSEYAARFVLHPIHLSNSLPSLSLRRGKPSASARIFSAPAFALRASARQPAHCPRFARGRAIAPLFPAARGTPDSSRLAPGLPLSSGMRDAEGTERRVAPFGPRLRRGRVLRSTRAPRGAPSRLFKSRAVASGRDAGGAPAGSPYPGSFRRPSFPPRPALEGQPVLMPADGWPGPPGCGDHVYPRPRAPHPPRSP